MQVKRRLAFLLLFFLHITICIAQIRKPGIYIQEISRPSPRVAEVATAVPAFTGYTQKANGAGVNDLLFVAKKINSFIEFQNFYGLSDVSNRFVLYQSIQVYFENGGGPCYIVSIGNYNNNIQKQDFVRGLDIISKNDETTLLLFPDAVNLLGNDLYEVQKNALKQAAALGDRFCILDLKFADNKALHAAIVNEFRNNIGTNNLQYGAVYTPFLKIAGAAPMLPPSAAVAGQYCSVDRNSGVWKAPANVSLNMTIELAYAIDNSEQDVLSIDNNNGKSINAIRKYIGKGFLIWGSRTLAGNDNEWQYVPVRRFFNMAEESIKNACMSFVFEPNNANTWAKVKTMIENYLTIKWKQGGLLGLKAEQAFFVKIGLNQTMTALDVSEGRMIIEIGMATKRPAEFIILRITQKMQTK